ncbi:MAG: hypothetical protein ACYDBS_08035 [Acidimicrobiales bacterium]
METGSGQAFGRLLGGQLTSVAKLRTDRLALRRWTEPRATSRLVGSRLVSPSMGMGPLTFLNVLCFRTATAAFKTRYRNW